MQYSSIVTRGTIVLSIQIKETSNLQLITFHDGRLHLFVEADERYLLVASGVR